MKLNQQLYSNLKSAYGILIIPFTMWLLYLMFFGFGRTQLDENIVRLKPIVSTLDFVSHSILWSNRRVITINIIGNIIMFVPFGFLGWLIPKYQKLKPLLIAFLSILIIIEALQYFTRLGVFDVDDIIFNTIGVWLGFKLRQKIDATQIKNI